MSSIYHMPTCDKATACVTADYQLEFTAIHTCDKAISCVTADYKLEFTAIHTCDKAISCVTADIHQNWQPLERHWSADEQINLLLVISVIF